MSDLFDFKAPRNRFAVMGNPVTHSMSPQIHTLFAQQCGISIDYQRTQVDSGGFKQAVSHFMAHEGAGLNVTVPFKVEAWDLCQRPPNALSERARMAEAVNTLEFGASQEISGDNTDGIGLVRDLTSNLSIAIEGRNVLIVGAGGAVRGVLGPLLDCGPAALHIVNRTASKAMALAERFGQFGYSGLVSGGLDSARGPYEVIINGTAASLGGEVPALDRRCMSENTAVYDMMYGVAPTPFMLWAQQAGSNSQHDGLGMLVEQAAESFFIWHGKQPETASVIAALRAEMARPIN